MTDTTKTLEELAADVTACGNTVKQLKTADPMADPTAIQQAVDALLQAKRAYAAQNNGLLPDGKAFIDPAIKLTKAQKKAAAGGGGGGGPAKPVRLSHDPSHCSKRGLMDGWMDD
eukprot:scaffold10708_cov130-Amphora_coffeaeformis.AAC.1